MRMKEAARETVVFKTHQIIRKEWVVNLFMNHEFIHNIINNEIIS